VGAAPSVTVSYVAGGSGGGAGSGGGSGGCSAGAAGGRPGLRSSSDLVVSRHLSHARIQRGGRVTYRITITNRGPDPADRVRLRPRFRLPFAIVSVRASQGTCDQRRPIECQLGRLRIRDGRTVTIVAQATVAGEQVVTIPASSESGDPNPRTATATATTRVIPIAGVQLTATPQTLQVGRNTRLRVRVTNPNGVALNALRTCVRWPAPLAFARSEPRATRAFRSVCWTRNSLARGRDATFTVFTRANRTSRPTVGATVTARGTNSARRQVTIRINR